MAADRPTIPPRPRGTCPPPAAGTGHSATMSALPLEGWTCPAERAGAPEPRFLG